MKDKNISVHGSNDPSNISGNSNKFNLSKSIIFKTIVQSLLLWPQAGKLWFMLKWA